LPQRDKNEAVAPSLLLNKSWARIRPEFFHACHSVLIYFGNMESGDTLFHNEWLKGGKFLELMSVWKTMTLVMNSA